MPAKTPSAATTPIIQPITGIDTIDVVTLDEKICAAT